MARWYLENRCVSCKGSLSDGAVMYSSGQCPRCGYKDPSACTVVEVTEHPYFLESVGYWWQFWLKPIRRYKEDF